MVIYPARHLFEAKFPSLEADEKEIYYHHPVHNLYVNQLGVIFCDEDEYTIYCKHGFDIVYSKLKRANCGSKGRVIWECYNNQEIKNPHFLYANGNPYDTRKENLVLIKTVSAKDWAGLSRIKKAFTKASVEHLLGLEVRLQALGFTQKEAFTFLGLPNWLMVARRDYPGAPPVVGQSRRGGSQSKTTEEEKAEVCSVFKAGLTYSKIVAHMGWKSCSRVKKVVKDAGLSR